MRMLHGDINVYWYHDELTPFTVRAACYGTTHDSGALIPDVGDVIRDFYGEMGEPITVRVTEVKQTGQGVVAFEVRVTTVSEEG
jgi:hypothetical protein